jgi:hypothetical protein
MGKFEHSKCAGKVRGIEAFHRDNRRWADIAYNAIVCPHGYVFEGRGVNTKSAANGNSTDNDDWYAVCYLGGVGDGFTAEGKQGFRDARTWLREKGNAGAAVNGHRDHKSTMCPGDEIYKWLHAEDWNKVKKPAKPTRVQNFHKELDALLTKYQKSVGKDRVAFQRAMVLLRRWHRNPKNMPEK